ncbi:MAG: ABC transporter permease subunit [Rhodobacteraceae bacterium]|nr:ABC transporter permease subunit [Paracoccaceae bacterium]
MISRGEAAGDGEAARRQRRDRWLLPAAVLALALVAWQALVSALAIPHYILPSPGRVAQALAAGFPALALSWWMTLKVALMALALAAASGAGLAVLLTRRRWLEMSFLPWMVVLQVTPIIAIAPLIFIYIDGHLARVLFCAWLVAFFPVLANTVLGLRSADEHLGDLMTIHRARGWQRLWLLELPSALPHFLAGVRIAGGLSLVGAVVAEFAMGSGGAAAGLAFRILEASYRLETARMFAALVLIVLTGVAIHLAVGLLAHLLLRRWHASALARES